MKRLIPLSLCLIFLFGGCAHLQHFFSSLSATEEETEQYQTVLEPTETLPSSGILFPGTQHIQKHEIDFTHIDTVARNVPRIYASHVRTLSRYLLDQSTNQWEFVRGAFVWVTDNISYDTESFFSGRLIPNDADTVLIRKTAVCQGYAELFQAILQEAGMESEIVSGYARGYGFNRNDNVLETNHAWNRVKINEAWYLFDPTWGAGHLSGRDFRSSFNSFYFAPVGEALIFSHFPKNPLHQHIENPLSSTIFSRLPRVRSELFRVGLSAPETLNQFVNGRSIEFVEIYNLNEYGVTLTHLNIPWNKNLSSGQTYQFTLYLQTELPVYFVNNRTYERLNYADGVIDFSKRVNRGDASIVVQTSQATTQYYYLLKWEVR